MPSPDYTIRQNDSGGTIVATLRDAEGAAVNIGGATVRFHMKTIGIAETLKIDSDADNDQVGDGSDGTKGTVSYVWQAADTDTAGLYLAEWEVTYSGGEVQTFPNDRYLLIRVTKQISSAA